MDARTVEEFKPLLAHHCGGDWCDWCGKSMKMKLGLLTKHIKAFPIRKPHVQPA